MKLDPSQMNIAPLVGFYNLNAQGDVEANSGLTTEEVILQFRTTREAAEALLPEPFTVPEVPIVSLITTYLDNHPFLNGGGYALSGVYIRGRFDGEEHHLDGDFAAVLPENNNLCILSGRDIGGNAKFYCDIDRPVIWNDGTVVSNITIHGDLFYGFQLNGSDGQLQPVADLGPLTKALNAAELFAYKVIPDNDEWGLLNVSRPIAVRGVRTPKKAWMGKTGKVEWGTPRKHLAMERAAALYFQEHLPIEEILTTIHWVGTLDWVTGSYTLK